MLAEPARDTAEAVAAFDFDKTLTTKDSLLRFLVAIAGWPRLAFAVMRSAPEVMSALALGGTRRDRAREKITRLLLSGRRAAEVDAVATAVGRAMAAQFLRADVAERLAWHVRSGHRVVVVSASFARYVGVAVDDLGVERVIATEWEVDSQGVLTGALVGGNVRGARKAELLRSYLGTPRIAYAYGDSAGDAEMLAMSDTPTLVGRRRLASLQRPFEPDCSEDLRSCGEVVMRLSHGSPRSHTRIQTSRRAQVLR
ncbi:MAG: HAD-IB family hydrolase [Ilumatobacter sp.]|uniref:HAD-IB family hydrolase n=1 Tax=Ilumatobacter sp. TaxID=1967498 RepID=UPI00391B2C9A